MNTENWLDQVLTWSQQVSPNTVFKTTIHLSINCCHLFLLVVAVGDSNSYSATILFTKLTVQIPLTCVNSYFFLYMLHKITYLFMFWKYKSCQPLCLYFHFWVCFLILCKGRGLGLGLGWKIISSSSYVFFFPSLLLGLSFLVFFSFLPVMSSFVLCFLCCILQFLNVLCNRWSCCQLWSLNSILSKRIKYLYKNKHLIKKISLLPFYKQIICNLIRQGDRIMASFYLPNFIIFIFVCVCVYIYIYISSNWIPTYHNPKRVATVITIFAHAYKHMGKIKFWVIYCFVIWRATKGQNK